MRRGAQAAVLLCVLAVAGCGGFVTDRPAETSATTLTPAPVPGGSTPATATGTATPSPTPTGTREGSRYFPLGPTCERPPGLVVAIQVGALRNNDPATNEGIETAWRFASPENRRATGPFPNFVRIVEEGYRPLLDAESVTYGPVTRTDGFAVRRVTATAANGTVAGYDWTLEKQAGGEYAGCWLTSSVRNTTAGSGGDRNGSQSRSG